MFFRNPDITGYILPRLQPHDSLTPLVTHCKNLRLVTTSVFVVPETRFLKMHRPDGIVPSVVCGPTDLAVSYIQIL